MEAKECHRLVRQPKHWLASAMMQGFLLFLPGEPQERHRQRWLLHSYYLRVACSSRQSCEKTASFRQVGASTGTTHVMTSTTERAEPRDQYSIRGTPLASCQTANKFTETFIKDRQTVDGTARLPPTHRIHEKSITLSAPKPTARFADALLSPKGSKKATRDKYEC